MLLFCIIGLGDKNMNVLIGANTAYLSFVPSAGSSIMCSIIAIILHTVLSVLYMGLYFKAKMHQDL